MLCKSTFASKQDGPLSRYYLMQISFLNLCRDTWSTTAPEGEHNWCKMSSFTAAAAAVLLWNIPAGSSITISSMDLCRLEESAPTIPRVHWRVTGKKTLSLQKVTFVT